MSEMTIEFDLGDDYPELREGVAKVCKNYPPSYWEHLENQPPSGSYPTEFVNALTKTGFLSALIQVEYGGLGLPVRGGAAILETIHAEGCTAGPCHAQMYTMGTVLRHGSAEQKQRYLPKIAKGELRLQAFGVTEPTTGSDTTQLKTRADKVDGGYLIKGQKVWISRAGHSDLMLLLARTTPADQVEKRAQGVSVFLVDMKKAKENGMVIKPIDAMINHNTTEIFFDDVWIPEDSLVGEEGKGFRYILDGMNAERCLVSSETIGNGRYLLDLTIKHANERNLFGKALSSNQAIQFAIVQAYVQLETADLMVRKAAAMFDAGIKCGAEANMSKILSGEAVWACAQVALNVFGAAGLPKSSSIQRKWRESRTARNSPISPNMVLNFVGQHVLGLPRSY